MPGSVLDLGVAVDDLLAAVVAGLDTIPTFADAETLLPAPSNQYTSPGLPAHDCPPLVVAWAAPLTVYTFDAGQTQMAGGHTAQLGARHIVTLKAQVVRCAVMPNAKGQVNLTRVTEASRQHYADGWAVRVHVKQMIREKVLWSWCSEVFQDPAIPLDPKGDTTGWEFTYRVVLPGYESEVAT